MNTDEITTWLLAIKKDIDALDAATKDSDISAMMPNGGRTPLYLCDCFGPIIDEIGNALFIVKRYSQEVRMADHAAVFK